MSSTPHDEEVFDEWFSETHGGTGEFDLESDVDEVTYDQMDDEDLF